ncbi:MAG TPA: hypothetical protein PLN22_16090, partial [Ignavibacteria bacterium]|nr:hypothetical protein [Ignavibacteria bacterium]
IDFNNKTEMDLYSKISNNIKNIGIILANQNDIITDKDQNYFKSRLNSMLTENDKLIYKLFKLTNEEVIEISTI